MNGKSSWTNRCADVLRGVHTSSLQQCAEPEQALQNWMDRDVAFARWIENRTFHHNLRCIVVDGQSSIEENASRVAEHFRLT